MKAICTILFVLTLLLSCSDSNPADTENKKQSEPAIVQKGKPGATYQDTLFINNPAAVFFKPDSIQLSKLKAITDSMIYSSMEHDCFYQIRNARRTLSSFNKSIPVYEIIKGRYIQFRQADGSYGVIDLDLNNDPCGLYLFRPDKEPLFADMTNIATELFRYFSN